MKRLVIAEKPSVGISIAHVLGVKGKHEGYLENSEYIVSWCFGHITELSSPESYDERYIKWRYEDLPIIPSQWKHKIPRDKYRQFEALKKLMNRSDVSEVVNACDAGREGELIFRNMYDAVGCNKPVLRLWISSMEDTAIKQGFNELKPGNEYNNLYASARCRELADWLVGINATRLFSVLYHRTLNVGRVVSPTLALLVQRETEISKFKPEPYYTVQLLFDGFAASGDKVKTKEEAERCLNKCKNASVTITNLECKEKTEKAPLLFDLTSLQREANRTHGYTAQQTLDYVQSLYEKKLCTYPRTDSSYLTDDMETAVRAIVLCSANIAAVNPPNVVIPGQVCNSKKVSDHHAIIPTMVAGEINIRDLPAGEREMLKLIAKQVVMAVCEPYRYEETICILKCGDTEFNAKGRRILNDGWRSYVQQENTSSLPDSITIGSEMIPKEAVIKDGMTTPPKHYTEDTLLSAMENAGKADIPEDAERKGLGTPATRASMIEKLITTGFAERRKASKTTTLIPSHAGISLITVLPEQLHSPKLTAEWEHKLKMIEHGKIDPHEFIAEISIMVNDLVKKYEVIKDAETLFPSGREVIGKCPRCGGNVTESNKGFFCESSSCRFGLWRDNKFLSSKKIDLTKTMAAELLRNNAYPIKGLLSERTGRPYDALLMLSDDGAKIMYSMRL